MTARKQKMKMVSVNFEQRQVDALLALSARTRIPQSVLVREAIDKMLAAHQRRA